MKVHSLHDWQVTVAQAQDIQRRLASHVVARNEVGSPRSVLGVDISGSNPEGIATGAAVVMSYPELTVVEVKTAQEKPGFPYVPGLLSFRESPLVLAACRKLASTPDLALVDGQGIAHPRRLGLASHLGLFLDLPTIGCAKSRLWGNHGVVGAVPGSFAELSDGDEVIGAALRTRLNVKPLYVSIGHKVDLQSAIRWVLKCCHRYRSPEPLRLAHLAASGRFPESARPAQQNGPQ